MSQQPASIALRPGPLESRFSFKAEHTGYYQLLGDQGFFDVLIHPISGVSRRFKTFADNAVEFQRYSPVSDTTFLRIGVLDDMTIGEVNLGVHTQIWCDEGDLVEINLVSGAVISSANIYWGYMGLHTVRTSVVPKVTNFLAIAK